MFSIEPDKEGGMAINAGLINFYFPESIQE